MFSEWIVPADEVHVFWSTQSDAGPADLDSCPSSHHPALPVIHFPLHLPSSSLPPSTPPFISSCGPLAKPLHSHLHYTSPPVPSNQWLSSLQHPNNVFVLTFKMAENPSYSFQNGFVIQPDRAMNHTFEPKLSLPHTTVEELFSISINYLENIGLFWSHS